LGIFYLLMNQFLLAHECFKKSQAIDPEYNAAWIGQAFIAETVDIADCIDLYGHAVELGLHVNISLHSIFYTLLCLYSHNCMHTYTFEYKNCVARVSCLFKERVVVAYLFII